MPPDKVQLAHAMIEPSETSHALPFSRMPPQWDRVLIQFKYSLVDEDWEAKACQQFFKAASALMHYGAPELTLTAYMQLNFAIPFVIPNPIVLISSSSIIIRKSSDPIIQPKCMVLERERVATKGFMESILDEKLVGFTDGEHASTRTAISQLHFLSQSISTETSEVQKPKD
ncbi:hypothetical protein CNMCM6805_004754 [Aspergillus fumigatiaffinis]|uniref:Uncharacterized protein n=1 Tax=Aspergillus fumigatiaffinis TaxID=340414 RepID=A0A8H4GFF3_9EURO|nr:hypothetical protein CNMCM6457_004617 [Aspergillus fumigatiaffinis]KAF4226302.1 hypothetical protein CNMCM6805_004754 [Aspergillus fumigatiaffinis]